jgi:tRNA nucleotidyltransferase (CCA-adding enzyme)
MDRLLPAAVGLPPLYLVGGAVRDLLLDAPVVDIDLAVEGDGPRTARELAARLGGDTIPHERFGTATVRAPGLEFDVAATRAETYAEPGALPEVAPAPLEVDLGRRDFAINAMAAALRGDALGRLHDPHGGRGDLDARAIRILHDRSFIDDPTRLLRAVRYEVRLDFAMDEPTAELAREAVRRKAPATVSGARIRDELLDLLGEHAAPRGVERMVELGLLGALCPALNGDAELVASAKLGAGETGADPALAALAALLSPRRTSAPPAPARPGTIGEPPPAPARAGTPAGEPPPSLATGLELALPRAAEAWVDSLALRADERDAVLRAARKAPQLARLVRSDLPASAIHALLHCEHPETLALTLAHGAPGGPILRYLADLRGVQLEITGHDLVEAGIPESPAVGRALEETLRRKLDGELAGRDEELRYALEVARSST